MTHQNNSNDRIRDIIHYLDELEASGKITIEEEKFYNLFKYSFTPKQNNDGQEIPVYAWFINHEPFSEDKDTMDWANTAVSMYVEKNLIT